MNWINAFEVICYLITSLLIADMIKKRNRQELCLFLSSALAGFMLELLAVRLTGIYHYSNAYYISIGTVPNQFPFFGGLMWGGLTVCALRICKKFRLGVWMTALLSGWLVVSMDILLDVAAIRLNGGFWVWEGRPITLTIDHHMMMSVIWVNFLGYMFETPALVGFTLLYHKKGKRPPVLDVLAAVAIGLAGVAFVGLASTVSLWLDGLTDEWFSCLAFICLWCAVLLKLCAEGIKQRKQLTFKGKKDRTLIVFWAAVYGYCLAALSKLGIFAAVPLYAAFAVFLTVLTMTLCLIGIKNDPLPIDKAP